MDISVYAPHPALRPYVHSLCLRAGTLAEETEAVREILPDGCVELVVGAGAPLVMIGAGEPRETPPAYRVGLLCKPLRLRSQGPLRLAVARLYPWATLPLLGERCGPTAETIAPLDASWRRPLDEITRALGINDGRGAIATLQRALLHRLEHPVLPSPGVLAAAVRLRERGGRATVRELATHADLSPRQLERAFDAAIGLAPKTLARTVRFEHARDHLWANPGIALAALADAHGYADQAHFTREFRAFTDATPAPLAARLRARSSSSPVPGVAFLQDPDGTLRHTLGEPFDP